MKEMHLLKLVMAMALVLAFSVSANATETDDRIESSFKNSFVYKRYLADDQIRLSSKDGAVTLTGTAQTDTNKKMAEDVAEALPGVKSVDNRIQLSGDPPEERSDLWVHTKVKASLLYHRNVPGLGTSIEVNDGIVTVTGEADSQAEKDLVTEYVKDVVGVKSVNNQMTVAASSTEREQTWTESIDDASITAQAKGALMWNRSTSAMNTSVTTNDGVVTISGNAKNAAEKSLAENLVSNIHGVKRVNNQMTIAE